MIRAGVKKPPDTLREIVDNSDDEKQMDPTERRLTSYKKKLVKPLQFNVKIRRKMEMGMIETERIMQESQAEFLAEKEQKSKMLEDLKELTAISRQHDKTAGFIKKTLKKKKKKQKSVSKRDGNLMDGSANNQLKSHLKPHVYDFINLQSQRRPKIQSSYHPENIALEQSAQFIENSPRNQKFMPDEMIGENVEKIKIVKRQINTEQQYKSTKRKMLLYRQQQLFTEGDQDNKTLNEQLIEAKQRSFTPNIAQKNRQQSYDNKFLQKDKTSQYFSPREPVTMSQLPKIDLQNSQNSSRQKKLIQQVSKKQGLSSKNRIESTPESFNIQGNNNSQNVDQVLVRKQSTENLQNVKPVIKPSRLPLEKINSTMLDTQKISSVTGRSDAPSASKRISFSPYKTISNLDTKRMHNESISSRVLDSYADTQMHIGSPTLDLNSQQQSSQKLIHLYQNNHISQPILKNKNTSQIQENSHSHVLLHNSSRSKSPMQIDLRQNLLSNRENAAKAKTERYRLRTNQQQNKDSLKFLLQNSRGGGGGYQQESFRQSAQDQSSRQSGNMTARAELRSHMGERSSPQSRGNRSQSRDPDQEKSEQVSQLFSQLIERKKRRNEEIEDSTMKEMHKQVKNLIKMDYRQSSELEDITDNQVQQHLLNQMGYDAQQSINKLLGKANQTFVNMKKTGTFKGAESMSKRNKVSAFHQRVVTKKKTLAKRVA